MSVEIDGTLVGVNYSPYIIAEMSGNHNQSFDQAKSIIQEAKLCGVNAIKLQLYKPDTITLKCNSNDFLIQNNKSLWNNRYLYDLYEEAHTRWEWVDEIFSICAELGITCFSSVFDESAIDFLEDRNTVAYKIASFENNHIPLIRKAASTKKPIIISTGCSSLEEIEEAVENARDAGCKKLILLKCTSDYPADVCDTNLRNIPFLKNKFKCEVGLSDHTLGVSISLGSIGYGACLIEKHFTLSRKLKGVDSEFSANKEEMKFIVNETKNIWKARGKLDFEISESEKKSRQFKRSIYISKDLKKGEKFSKENIKVVRPGYSIHPRYYENLLGKKSSKNYKLGDRLDNEEILNN